jgi:hypothetical protein
VCKPGFEYFNGSCYYFSAIKKIWNFAKLDCVAKNSSLLIINSQEEFNYITNYANNKFIFSLYVKTLGFKGNFILKN